MGRRLRECAEVRISRAPFAEPDVGFFDAAADALLARLDGRKVSQFAESR